MTNEMKEERRRKESGVRLSDMLAYYTLQYREYKIIMAKQKVQMIESQYNDHK